MFEMESAKRCTTPIEVDENDSGEITNFFGPYQEADGALMYQMGGMRPGISFNICCLLKYVERPAMRRWKALKRAALCISHN